MFLDVCFKLNARLAKKNKIIKATPTFGRMMPFDI